ncbi:MAG: ATP-binding protein [Pseudomonadota bacterium]
MQRETKNGSPPDTTTDEARPHLSRDGYQGLRRNVVLATATVSLVPLFILTAVTYLQYQRSMRSEAVVGVQRITANAKHSVEFLLSERRAALSYLVHDRSYEELCDSNVLARIIRNVNRSFRFAAFVDLGVIDSKGNQVCYSGPHELTGLNYQEQDWFKQVLRRGVYTSDMFLGFRNSPHFAIATRQEWHEDDFYILRATVDAEMLSEEVLTAGISRSDDLFLINTEGVLQTPSRRFGEVLGHLPLGVPPVTRGGIEVTEQRDVNGTLLGAGYARIDDSPFVVLYLKPLHSGVEGGLFVQLLAFLAVSATLILGVILWGSGQFVNNIRGANMRRAALMHQVEYSNKLASIGRLAAGVAHEINNPLAIINEKAGLLQDIVSLDEGFPRRDKILSLVDSVLGSVDRCKKVTHRLLGFAKHMDIQHEPIDLPTLLQEVVSFLEKESEYRRIEVAIVAPSVTPSIESDRGQLQQVFLNILNNAMAAVRDGGHIGLRVEAASDGQLQVTIADDGIGIPRENLDRIFEPFFTTKEGSGTGLGLSITYGIVKKLGGEILVESEVGKGTTFTILLPLQFKEGFHG